MELTAEQEKKLDRFGLEYDGLSPQQQIKEKIFATEYERAKAEEERQKALKVIMPIVEYTKEEAGIAAKQVFKRPFEIWQEEAASGLITFREALKERSFLSGIGGLAQFTFSPLIGFARAWGGEPVEKAPLIHEITGYTPPPGAARFGGQMVEEAALFLDPLYVGTKVRQIPKAVKLFEQLRRKGLQELPELRGKGLILEKILDADLGEIAAQAMGKRDYIRQRLESGLFAYVRPGEKVEHFTQRLDPIIHKKLTEAFVKLGRGSFEEGRRIFKQVRDSTALGDIEIEEWPEILRRHNLTPEEGALLLSHDVSDAARVMAHYSTAIRRLKRAFKDSPEALRILEDSLGKEKYGESFGDKLFEWYSRIKTVRRSAMISQLATAMRNLWSQAGRVSLGAFDTSLQTYLKCGSAGVAMKAGMNTIWATMNRLSKNKRQLLTSILESDAHALQAGRLLSQPVHEVMAGSKIAHFLTILNRTQEHFFRKLAFEAKLRSLLDAAGLPPLEKIKPSQISRDVLEESIQYALEMTFAKSPQAKWQRDLIRLFNVPLMDTIQPYPRFNFANAIPFILDHSPVGYLRAFSPKALEELASGNATKFAYRASRATIGTMMYGMAWHIRQSDYAGERYYQIKLPGKFDPKTGEQLYIDTRAYAPFSTPLFIAEVFLHPERIKMTDWAQNIIGLNRISGSGLTLIDLLRAKTPESKKRFFLDWFGQVVGSFGTPARMFKDIGVGTQQYYKELTGEPEFISEDAYIRDTRINPEIGPFIDNIPKLSRLLAEAKSPLKAARLRRLHPLLRQTTGLTITSKNKIQAEVDRLGMDYSYIYPRWGSREVNAKGAEYMGPIVEMYANKLLEHENYQKLDPLRKQIVLHAFFQLARQEARWILQEKEPEIAAFARLEGSLNRLQEKLLEQALGKSLNQIKRDFKKRRRTK